ncbi:hypothetical protein [Lacrimispora indolis]|uniref:hypothetical protein n=1 Tax=Lacrimispora indolis TaxID=69825 RepID=UPI0012EBA0DE|nr:hypothetical protein [[Clostridium] methoxybenzovorans]
MSGYKNNVDDKMLSRLFYFPICNEDEIDRVLNVRTAQDYLLKLRADTIVNNMRLFRVYRNRALSLEGEWSLEKSFEIDHYTNFLQSIPLNLRKRCDSITYGDIFSNIPNGQIFKTDYGPVITISDSLRFFF